MKPSELTSTQYERFSLDGAINLSDGHTRQPLTPSQQEIIHKLPELFTEAQDSSQFGLEKEFIDSFFELSNQSRCYDYDRYLLSYSSSSAIKIIASHFRQANMTVALIEPVFDNIYNIIKREGLPLHVLPEEILGTSQEFIQYLKGIDPDVVWIVCPNNPTGWSLDSQDFDELIRYCASNDKILVCDFCFRFFCPDLISWDQYGLLEKSGVSFITIEDTGKTWSTLDMKLGLLVCSNNLFDTLYQMHDDLLLNVSPFHLRLLTAFIKDTSKHGLDDTIHYYVKLNREILWEEFSGSVLEPVNPRNRSVTMEWIRINSSLTGEELWAALREFNIHILPGSNFYWNSPEKGRQFIRIPLTRNPDLIANAAPIIKRVANLWNKR